jgi:hypothetical protein
VASILLGGPGQWSLAHPRLPHAFFLFTDHKRELGYFILFLFLAKLEKAYTPTQARALRDNFVPKLCAAWGV